jgi:anaerobic magnesium-protoporphyrin IX monomethyl ester cyclase
MKFTFVLPNLNWLWDYKSQFALGVLYLSTQLKKMGCEVNIFDSNARVVNHIGHADVFAFSAVYPTYQSCVSLAKQIKEKFPMSKYIIGGVHTTTSPNDIDPIFDSIFLGQAELTIMKYVEDLRNKTTEKYYVGGDIGDLDNYYADRTILPMDYLITPSIFTGDKTYTAGGSSSIMFSRGCPYKCRFCCSPILYKKTKYRSVDNIVFEIKNMYDNYGVKQYRVQDDTFTASKAFIDEFANKVAPLDIYYRCSTRVNHVTEDLIGKLYASGCREIGLGLEVSDNEALKILNKGITVEQSEKAINIIRKFPIMVRGFYMIGMPLDSYKTVQANIDFIEKLQLNNVVVGKFIPFPGNDMYINMAKYNIKSVKPETCMSIAKVASPNILRTDISEEEHTKIMQVFIDYLIKKGFLW